MLQDHALVPTVPASDIDRALAWYREKLGFEPSAQDPDGGYRFRSGDSWFSVYPTDSAGTNAASAGLWLITDFEETVRDLRSRGIEHLDVEIQGMKSKDGILTTPDGDKAAWFTDSEGNTLGIVQES